MKDAAPEPDLICVVCTTVHTEGWGGGGGVLEQGKQHARHHPPGLR